MRIEIGDFKQAKRYFINGLAATLVHFFFLSFIVQSSIISSKGLANFLAAIIGTFVSFLGSRYYVFQNYRENFIHQASKFGLLYGVISICHGLLLYTWSDLGGLNYRIGFLVATTFQIFISYYGNKCLVFK